MDSSQIGMMSAWLNDSRQQLFCVTFSYDNCFRMIQFSKSASQPPFTSNMIIFTLAVFYLSSVVATFTPCAFTLCHGSPLANSRTKLNNDLWSEPPQNEEEKVEMSQSLPFVTRPKLLDGSLAADAGFE